MGIPIAAMIVIAALTSLLLLARAAVKSKGRSRRSLAAITVIAVSDRPNEPFERLATRTGPRGPLDLYQNLALAADCILSQMIVRALPGADHFSQDVHYDVVLWRYDNKNEVRNS